jgi:hypothetical protein
LEKKNHSLRLGRVMEPTLGLRSSISLAEQRRQSCSSDPDAGPLHQLPPRLLSKILIHRMKKIVHVVLSGKININGE